MLILSTATSWRGPSAQATWKKKLSSSNTKEMVLNTSHMSEVESDGSGAKFKYINNLYGRRSHGNDMKIDESIANVRTAADATYEHEYLTLPVFEDDDTSTTAVDKDFPIASFCYAIEDGSDSNYSWVWIAQGEFTKKILVNYTLQQIVFLADEGETTTA